MSTEKAIEEDRQGFWRRQFAEKQTRPQLIFDIIFAIIAPIVCFWFDPFVFRGGFLRSEDGILQYYKLFVYLFSAIAICTFILWLCFASHLKKQSGFISGIFLTGALFTFLIGLLLSPFSLIGIFINGIGLLGFIPFFTAFAYWRNGIRAWKEAKAVLSRPSLVWSMLSGVIFLISVPTIVDYPLSRISSQSLQILLSDNPDALAKEKATARLKYFGWYIDSNEIVDNYRFETDELKKVRLAAAYQALKNQDIEKRIAILRD